MALFKINPTTTSAWQKLNQHYAQMQNNSIKELFANDAKRAENFHIQWKDFLIDRKSVV